MTQCNSYWHLLEENCSTWYWYHGLIILCFSKNKKASLKSFCRSAEWFWWACWACWYPKRTSFRHWSRKLCCGPSWCPLRLMNKSGICGSWMLCLSLILELACRGDPIPWSARFRSHRSHWICQMGRTLHKWLATNNDRRIQPYF